MQANWKDKLEEWAPEPPAAVWERLSEVLAEAPQPLFAQKLQQFSASPPENAWKAVSAQLDASLPDTIPVIRLFPDKILRWGSVAASVLLAFFLLQQTRNNNTDAYKANAATRQQTIIPLPDAVTDAAANKKPQSMQPAIAGITTQPDPLQAAFLPHPHISSDPLPTIKAERQGTVRIYELINATAPQVNGNDVERYIVVPIADDVAVRLPKKLYDLFRCGDQPVSTGCSELINSIRQQSAAPSFVTTADFPGLLELIQRVEIHQ